MYRGFNIEGLSVEAFKWKDVYSASKGLYSQQHEDQIKKDRREIKHVLENVFDKDAIDAQRLADSLFPQESVDVFISHSFKDIDKAYVLAAALRSIGLKTFIDSYVWGSAYDLLKSIDNKYCYQPGVGTYDYDKRNQSTAHVYMILNTALHKMIDRSEAFFFLETGNSIADLEEQKPVTIDSDKTYSAWIHSELMFSSMVEKREHRKIRPIFEDSAAINKSMEGRRDLQVAHPAERKHLFSLSQGKLENWLQRCHRSNSGLKKEHPLDLLYRYAS